MTRLLESDRYFGICPKSTRSHVWVFAEESHGETGYEAVDVEVKDGAVSRLRLTLTPAWETNIETISQKVVCSKCQVELPLSDDLQIEWGEE